MELSLQPRTRISCDNEGTAASNDTAESCIYLCLLKSSTFLRSTTMLRTFILPSLFFSILTASAQSSSNTSGPSVTLSYGTFLGVSEGGLDKFLGVPFAQAGRFELPQTPSYFSEPQQAIAFGPACPQQAVTQIILPNTTQPVLPNPPLNMSEDCLLVNIIKPANLSSNAQLPVLVWIYGGGFELGDTSFNDGSTVVARSIALGEPIIYVSANYRINAFGFAASKEIKAAGVTNLGIRDQRFALHWVQNNIHLFGGDKTKVTIWGQSAGAVSVGLHLVINGGNQEGLFRGAFMESGSPTPLRDVSAGQPFYDQLVVDTGCSNSTDTLACLKSVPLKTFENAVNQTPNLLSFMSLQLAWQPRIDGDVFKENPQDSVGKGAFSKIPFANGDCDDEGTLFTTPQQNITTPAEAINFLHSNYFSKASDEQFGALVRLYPNDPVDGSPFGTGTNNTLTPEFKRLAAFQGDVEFQAPRRFFLQIASKRQNVWSYLYKRGKSNLWLGSFHTSDLAPEFYSSTPNPDFQGTDAVVNFVNNLNPNHGARTNISSLIFWPMYSTNVEAPPLLTFIDPHGLVITNDTFRLEAMKAMTELSRQFPP